MAYMNPLETESEIEKYKEWLSSKGTHYLRCVLGIYERDKTRANPKYLKLDLRTELATQELNKRIE